MSQIHNSKSEFLNWRYEFLYKVWELVTSEHKHCYFAILVLYFWRIGGNSQKATSCFLCIDLFTHHFIWNQEKMKKRKEIIHALLKHSSCQFFFCIKQDRQLSFDPWLFLYVQICYISTEQFQCSVVSFSHSSHRSFLTQCLMFSHYNSFSA